MELVENNAEDNVEAYQTNQVNQVFGKPFQGAKILEPQEEAILKQAFNSKNGIKIKRLWGGDISDYGSKSEADQAFCTFMSIWFNRDAFMIDKMFQLSDLIDDTYVNACQPYSKALVENAIAGANSLASEVKAEEPYHLTDDGNATRMLDRNGNDLRYCIKFKDWYIWNNYRWIENCEGKIESLWREIVKGIREEAAANSDETQQKNLFKYADKCESVKCMRDMNTALSSMLLIQAEDFDKDINLINDPKGTYNLKTFKYQAHKRSDFITKMTIASYDENAPCLEWIKHLKLIFDNDEELFNYFQMAMGCALTGDVSVRKFFIAWGVGFNGKSATLNYILKLMGDYALALPEDTLLMNYHSSATTDVADLKGSRFALASEIPPKRTLKDSLLKSITGGDVISARHMAKDNVRFKPQCSLWMCANEKPNVNDVGGAIWDRLVLIPFTVRIKNVISMTELHATFDKEQNGIYSWCIQGYKNFVANGKKLPSCKVVDEAHDIYKEETNIFLDYSENCLVFQKGLRTLVNDLYDSYKRYSEDHNEKPVKKSSFLAWLDTLGCIVQKSNSLRYRKNVGFKGVVTDNTNTGQKIEAVQHTTTEPVQERIDFK